MMCPLRYGFAVALAVTGFVGVNPAVAGCRDSPRPGMDWSGCRQQAKVLRGYDLSGGNFARADLSRTNLFGAELSRANLTGANLDGADARNINLSRAKLASASLNKTNLEDAYLYRTDLRGVDLTKTVGLRQAQLRSACGDQQTKLPDGLTVPAAWPCKE